MAYSYVRSKVRNHISSESLTPSLCCPCSSAPCSFSLPAMMQFRRQTLCSQPALNAFPPWLSSFPPPACCLTHKPDVHWELCYPSDSTTEAADGCSGQKSNYRQVIYTIHLVLQLLNCHREMPLQNCCASHWISISLITTESLGRTT